MTLATSSERAEDAWGYPWDEPENNKIARFFSSLKKSKIETTKCKKCSTLQWPPRSICSNCLSTDLSWVPLPSKGELVAFSKAYIGTIHGEIPPILVGTVHLEGGPRLLTRIVGADFESLEVGMPMKLSKARLTYGKPYWEFAPSKARRAKR
jgi:uncharacterized protein